MIRILGIPLYWKQPKRRWKCWFCMAEGWGENFTPPQHDRPDGRQCLQFEAIRKV